MTYEDLAFANQQLSGMLKSGIPLEGGLRRLCTNMRRGRLRGEFQALEADLARGVSLKDALATRKLPEFYVKMVQLGARTGDLPGVLTLVADYYQRAHLVATRLKGLMVYPMIVLVASLGLSAFVAVICSSLMAGGDGVLNSLSDDRPNFSGELSRIIVRIWTPAAGLALITLAVAIALMVPACRRYLRWWLPGFRENSLTNVASAMNLMLSSGSHLEEALEMTQHLEADTPAGAELQRWKSRLTEGHGKIGEIAAGSKVFPPLFVWLAAQGGEDLAAGFRKAADIYYSRALYRVEMLLYAALPMAVLVLGVMILGQFFPLFKGFTFWIDTLGDTGGLGP